MIPASFDYAAPETLKDALTLLSSNPEAKVLAGGQSLIPILKLRLAAPAQLIDLGRIPDLHFIAETNGVIRIGGMTTHHQVETSDLLREKCPLLAETAARIGDVQVRNRGTIGGSVVHADPAADYPAALLALGAKVRLVRRPPMPDSWKAAGDMARVVWDQLVSGAKKLVEEVKQPSEQHKKDLQQWQVLPNEERVLSIEEFLVDALTTAIEPNEILTEVEVPVEKKGAGVAYHTMVQPASGYAVVGAAVRLALGNGKISMARVGVTGAASKAYRATGVEQALEGQAPGVETFRAASEHAAEGAELLSDLHASEQYRAHLAAVQVRRALAEAAGRAR